MKIFFMILTLFMLHSINANAFFSTAVFKKDKEINFNHFFAFDIDEYKYEDHEKIFGSEYEKWNGDPEKLLNNEIDFKKISVLVDGDKHSLSLRKFKNTNWLRLQFEGYTCEQAKNKIPKKFINKQNYSDYVSDLSVMSMRKIEFTYDNKNSRVTFFCMGLGANTGSKATPDIAILTITSKDERPKVTPLKSIFCRLDEGKTNITNKWTKMKANSYLNFFIQDHNQKLLDQRKNYAGKNQIFNEEKIHTIKNYKKDKSKKKAIHYEYIIDRINGSFKYKRKDYDPDLFLKPKWGIRDGIIEVDYVGMCEKKTQQKKF